MRVQHGFGGSDWWRCGGGRFGLCACGFTPDFAGLGRGAGPWTCRALVAWRRTGECGVARCARNDGEGKARAGEEKKQIPFGKDRKKGKGRDRGQDKMVGSVVVWG